MSLIIAEIGTSHQGSLEKAKQLVDESIKCGANAVKFQWVYTKEILHPKTGFVTLPTGKIPLYERFLQLECKKDFYSKIKDYVVSKGAKFICSPFGLQSLEELLSINPDYVKIASPELNHIPLLKRLAQYRKQQKEAGKKMVPVIVSTGVSKLCDIEAALDILGKEDVFLLHCITSYPSPETEYNLSLIKNLKNIFGVQVGVSDHSLDPILVPVLQTLLGGTIIEKHITLSKKTDGLDDPVALEPESFAVMCHCVKQTESVLNRYGKTKGYEYVINQLKESYSEETINAVIGDGIKKLALSEKDNYKRTNRSLHYMKELKKGTKITISDIAVLRTEKELSIGIDPAFLDTVLGCVLTKDVKDGEGVLLEHFMQK